MTQRFLTFLAHGRAIWPACLAFVLIGTLAGCGGAVDPVAPEQTPAPIQSDLDEFVAFIDPVLLEGEGSLAVTAPGFGRWLFDGDEEPVIITLMPDEPIQFFWRAVDGVALDSRVTYRYGWNVSDPDDPQDPGWFGPPGAGYKMQQTQPRTVWVGTERLTIERWDGGRLMVRAVFDVWSMPVDP
jgi:hypothetical protein